MARLVIAPLAEQDLGDILTYIARDKPEAAVKWVQKIREKCAFLADNPEIGERRPELKTGEFLGSLVGSYVIFYRPIDAGIEIARVVHGARDTRNL
ncbi:MAG: type II toxin-antitoxin system RelE/ParE family toxin [Pirellulales bacterium]